jgi:RNase P protein component
MMRRGHDYVLIGRRAGLNVPFERLVEDFTAALRRLDEGRSK